MTSPAIIPRKQLVLLKIGLGLLGFMAMACLGLLIVTGMRAHAREVELQMEVGKLKARRHLETVEYESVEVDGCEYLIFRTGVCHAATCQNPIHLPAK